MNILIIGEKSYIGENIREYLNAGGHVVKEFDIQNNKINEEVFLGIDCVIHVAAIVHHKDIKSYDVYKKVNVALPYEVASMAKKCGVSQFVFFSSMAVYEDRKSLSGSVLDDKSNCYSTNFYGRSKLEAECALRTLEETDFKIAYLRPANVYGKNCKGTYMSTFRRIVQMLPIIPVAYEHVKQGMLYIENLCELVRLIVENKAEGIFPAQDKRTVSSVEIMCEIASALNMRKPTSKILGIPFRFFKFGIVNKLYGGIAYSDEYAITELGDYNICSFTEGIKKTFSE